MTWDTAPLQDLPAPRSSVSYQLTRTDVGNAARFADENANAFRFVVGQGWITWEGKRWAPATEGDLLRAAKAVVEKMVGEAMLDADEDRRKQALAWAFKSASRPRLEAMIKLAGADERFEVRPSDLDADPMLLTVGNGTLDLRTATLRPHRQEDLITRWTPIPYYPDATTSRWIPFLTEIFNGDENLIAFMRRAVGYALTGDTREHALLILHGSGANGKSVLLQTLRALLGDFAEVASIETFLEQQRDAAGASPDLAKLAGARLVIASESEANARLAESVIKNLTGGDAITARRLYSESFTFTPRFKLIIATNHRPTVRGADEGIWRRLRLVPFGVSFRGREDRALASTLMAELPGILAWAARGCLEWQRSGLGMAEAVQQATEEYRDASDVLGAFIADSLVVDPQGWLSNERATALYKAWCKAQGDEGMREQTFKKALGERSGIRRHKYHGVRGFLGIREMTLAEQSARDGYQPGGDA